MRNVKLCFAPSYPAAVREKRSERVRAHIRSAIANLQTFPDMGTSDARDSLKERFGEDIRVLVVEGYLVVYRHADDHVDVLALVSVRSVR